MSKVRKSTSLRSPSWLKPSSLVRLASVLALLCSSGVDAQSALPAEQNAPTPQRQGSGPILVQATLVEKPVWEFGLGGGYFGGYDYPASKDPNNVGLALPFFIYRSEVVRFAGRGGLGAVAVEKPRVKLDVSISGSLNAESSGNLARESMPDLDFLFELGPRLNVLLSRRQHDSGGISVVRWLTSARGVISTDFSSLDRRGYLFSTEVEWRRSKLFGSNFDVQAAIETTWAARKTHDYFYTVAPAYATTERPSYQSDAGYLGTKVRLGFGYRMTPAIRIFAAVNVESFAGAANEDSPLFETDQSTGFGLALVWTLRSSKQKIAIFEDD